jgi:hypothetical protein
LTSVDRSKVLSKAFINRALKQNLNPEAIGRILCHFCWDSIEFSQLILTVLVDCIDKLEDEFFPGFFVAIEMLLGMDDNSTSSRVNSFFEKFLPVMQKYLKYSGPTLSCVKFLMSLCSRNKTCSAWMETHHETCDWMEETIQSLGLDLRDEQ